MPVPLHRISMNNGDSIFVDVNGSVEMSLVVVVSNNRCFVRGPMNDLEFTLHGFIEHRRSEKTLNGALLAFVRNVGKYRRKKKKKQ